VSDAPAGDVGDAAGAGRPGPRSLHDGLLAELQRVVDEAAASGKALTGDELEAIGQEAVDATVPELVERITQDVIAREAVTGPADRARRDAFREALRTVWGEALDSLELLIGFHYETGRAALDELGDGGRMPDDARLQALFRLHARSCRTANEILVLLEAGHADGAIARCRTLHEIAVVASVLSRGEPALAERYADHAAVRTLGGMRELATHHAALGWEPIPEAEMQAATARVEELVRRHGGKPFRGQYGWAEGEVPPADGGRVTFHDLERAAGLAHFQVFVNVASASVHAGQQGFHSFGFPLGAAEVLYAGGSTSGLADPGQHAALSLGQVAGALALHLTTLDLQVMIGVLAKLAAHCQAAFVAAGEVAEERARRNMAAGG
jgi:hypothetical protein